MKLRHLALPILSVAGMGFALLTVRDGTRAPAEPPLVVSPPRSPYARTIAGAGIVEPSSTFVDVGASRGGIATEVAVIAGAVVSRGAVLFKQDPRAAEAARSAREADLASAKALRDVRAAEQARVAAATLEAEARLAKAAAAPRTEELPPLRARLTEAERAAADAEDRLARVRRMAAEGASMERDVVAADAAFGAAEAVKARVAAELALLEAGTWAPELEVLKASVVAARAAESAAASATAAAEAAIAAAEAGVAAAAVEVELLTTRAPIDGTILQCDLRAGEFVAAGPGAAAALIMGSVDPLHVRVDIDENDAGLFRAGAAAKAFVRGRGGADKPVSLAFVRVEPYVVPKKALTGSVQERVDVRVLQAIYRVEESSDLPALYCGQQVDVFVELPPEG